MGELLRVGFVAWCAVQAKWRATRASARLASWARARDTSGKFWAPMETSLGIAVSQFPGCFTNLIIK